MCVCIPYHCTSEAWALFWCMPSPTPKSSCMLALLYDWAVGSVAPAVLQRVRLPRRSVSRERALASCPADVCVGALYSGFEACYGAQGREQSAAKKKLSCEKVDNRGRTITCTAQQPWARAQNRYAGQSREPRQCTEFIRYKDACYSYPLHPDRVHIGCLCGSHLQHQG